MKTEQHFLQVQVKKPPVVEIDMDAWAAYVRFKNTKVAKTVDRSGSTIHMAIDLDAKGEVVGVESIGFNELQLTMMMKQARLKVPAAMLAKARIVPSAQPIPA